MDALDRSLLKEGAEAFVMFGSSENADMRYITRFVTIDPFVFAKKKDERGFIIVSQMEYDRASREAAVRVKSRSETGLLRFLENEKDRWRAYALMIHSQVGGPLLVPPDLPFALGKYLSDLTTVSVDSGTIPNMRARKQTTEISEIRKVQEATEAAMKKATLMISRSRPRKGILYLGKNPLTSERIRFAMHSCLLEQGCQAADTIVSCGKDAALPHKTGTGALFSEEPIVIDVFPKSVSSGYFTDMTRTVSKGAPATDIVEMFQAVRDAQDLATTLLRPGVTGAEVHRSVVEFFREQGFESGREGFAHNLGHGVGLEVHELPVLGPSGGILKKGNVVTIEPGLYYPKIGGVRLENIGVIRKEGVDCLTRFPRELVL
jgi:Xaa-Pro aminopeptidase